MPVSPVKGDGAVVSGRMPSSRAGMVVEPWIGSIDQSRAKPSQEEMIETLDFASPKKQNSRVYTCLSEKSGFRSVVFREI
jgi:hypothetical protein